MGHPDWQTYPNWRGAPFVKESVIFPMGGTVRGPFAVNNYQSIHVTAFCPADNMQLILRTFTDPTLTVQVEEIDITFNAGLTVNAIIPLSANTLSVVIENTGLAGADLDYSITPVNIPVAKPTFYGVVNVISVNNDALAAGGTANFSLPYMEPGLAHLFLNPHDATGKLNFSVFAGSPTATGGLVYRNIGPTVSDQRLIALADRAYFIQVVNTDGAGPHTFDAALIPVG